MRAPSVYKMACTSVAEPFGSLPLLQLCIPIAGTRSLEVIQLLLTAGVDVNQKNVLGMSAMLLVAGYGNDELVAMVLDAGGDPRARNDFGHTALHLAVSGKKDQLKKMKRLGSIEAAAADRSLNRRNLDLAIQEWARLHRDAVGVTGNKESLAKVGVGCRWHTCFKTILLTSEISLSCSLCRHCALKLIKIIMINR